MLVQPLSQYTPGGLLPGLLEGPCKAKGLLQTGQGTILPRHMSLIMLRCSRKVSALVLLMFEKSAWLIVINKHGNNCRALYRLVQRL